jgi:hypothetical protein
MNVMQKIEAMPHVVEVSYRGAHIKSGSKSVVIPWAELKDASRQDDPELRNAYAAMLSDAKDMARRGPLSVEVVQCQSGVGHRVRVVTVAGDETREGMCADDGMDCHGGGIGNDGYSFAEKEAKEIAARLGSRATLKL